MTAETTTQIGPQFPSFLAESMFRDGVEAGRAGTADWDYTQHGPVGAEFFLLGFKAGARV